MATVHIDTKKYLAYAESDPVHCGIWQLAAEFLKKEEWRVEVHSSYS